MKRVLELLLVLIVTFSLVGCSSDNENISKNSSEPKVEVTMVDFSSMSEDEIKTWGDENGITIDIEQEYSNDVEDGGFVSQSVSADEIAYQGDTVKVIYSMGVEPSKEYQNALEKAESYSDLMHMSKAAIYDQLTSQYGEQFPDDAAQWAIDHLNADYNANALAKAEDYSETMHMSKAAIYDQLTSSYGEQFEDSEAQYAIDNLDADYNANALEKAKDYEDLMSMSKNAIYDQLTSSYGEQFTASEAQYAIDHLDD